MIEYRTFRHLQNLMTAKPAPPDARKRARWQEAMEMMVTLVETQLPAHNGILSQAISSSPLSPEAIRNSIILFRDSLGQFVQSHPRRDVEVSLDDIPHETPTVDDLLDLTAAIITNFPLVARPKLIRPQAAALEAKIREFTAYLAADGMIGDPAFVSKTMREVHKMVIETRASIIEATRTRDELYNEEQLATAKLHEATATLNSVSLQAEKQLSDLIGEKDAAIKSLEELGSKVQPIQTNYDNFKKAIETKYQIDITRQLWRSRHRNNALAFWISAAVLIVLLVVLPGIAIFNYKSILVEIGNMLELLHPTAGVTAGTPPIGPDSNIATNGKDATAYAIAALNRLIFIAFPLGLYVWLVRLVVRFNGRSLTLMDDATTRQALMDTFYRIANDNGATDKEREMMLQAIFRPLPGHQNDSADFPNVIELVQKSTGPA